MKTKSASKAMEAPVLTEAEIEDLETKAKAVADIFDSRLPVVCDQAKRWRALREATGPSTILSLIAERNSLMEMYRLAQEMEHALGRNRMEPGEKTARAYDLAFDKLVTHLASRERKGDGDK